MSQHIQENPFDHFVDVAKREGWAATSTTDGYVFMFRTEVLRNLLLGSMEPALKIGVRSPVGLQNVFLDRNLLQAELDKAEGSLVLIIYTHQPLKN